LSSGRRCALHLVVAGEVAAINDTADDVLADVVSMEAPMTGE